MYQEVLSKTKDSGLPLRCPYDCAIELLAGAAIPHNRIYCLSTKDTQAMEYYIEEALKQGYSRPFTSQE